MKIYFVFLCSFASLAFAQNSPPKAALVCMSCHGEKGISANELWPNLAHQKRDYLIKQITAFKTGERKDPMMSPMAATLTKDDIEDIADFFSK